MRPLVSYQSQSDQKSYSQVPIKRVGHNKRVGWIVLKKMLNVQGESVPNKRVG